MFKICNEPINRGDITPFIILFLNIILEAEENLLYALTRRSNLYEQNLIYISELAARDKWDISTASLCIALLISSLFSKNGLNKRELLAQTGIKSSTTLSKKLSILKEYGLLKEKKEVNVIHYNLDYDNLR